MLPADSLDKMTRRAVMKAAGAALGVATLGGTAAGHNKFATGADGYLGDNRADAVEKTERIAYHTAGGVGSRDFSGEPEDAHKGAMTEFRIHDDLAFVTMFTARSESSQVGLAIFNISDFTRAETREEIEDAELTLLSFVRNDNNFGAPIDCKVSDDGNYVFICKQPLSALFGEAEDPEPNTDNHGFSPGAASLDAVDVSDPGNPEVTDSVNLSRWALGPHNCWYHQINGDPHVFTTHGADGVSGSMNVFRFDHTTGQLQQVNNWTWDEQDLRVDETATFDTYAHDIVIQDDPRHGIPIGYLSYIDAGTRVLDMSDPMNIEELGTFEMEISHHSVPAPTLIDDKRVMLCGQEMPSDDQGSTGLIHLVDVDPIDDVIEARRDGQDTDPVYLGCSRFVQAKDDVEVGERPAYHMYDVDGDDDIDPLDDWVLISPDGLDGGKEGWENAPGFEAEADAVDSDEEPDEYDGFGSFRLSTHNLDIDTEGNAYLGHYHAGSRFFEIVPEGETLPNPTDDEDDIDFEPGGDADQWRLVETGYNRRGLDIPEERTFVGDGEIDDGLTASTPFHWCLVERNGAAFAGGINGGPQVFIHDDIEVGNDTPIDITIDREEDLPALPAGVSTRITISVDTDEEVLVRDRLPADWKVIAPDDIDEVDIGTERKAITLGVEDGEAVYFVEAPDTTGTFTFGPVEYARADDGEPDVDSEFGGGNSTTNRLWRKENTATATITVAGSGIDL